LTGDFIARSGLLQRGRRVVVAVSGGLDSMALLHVCSQLAAARDWTLVVAHFNHALRGRESEADEAFVRDEAGALGLEFRSCRAEPGRLQSVRNKSMEMACRDARHQFLANVAREVGATQIALAHHADDQLELFLLRLLRGSGRGLAGMRVENPSPADERIRLVRPFLEVSRAELAAFVERSGVRFREDSSNASLQPERNRVRREILPYLDAAFARNVRAALDKSCRIVAEEADCVEGLARSWLAAGRRVAFVRLHPAVQRQCLRLQLLELGVDVGFELIEALRTRPGSWVSVSQEDAFSCSVDGAIERRDSKSAAFSTGELQAELSPEEGKIEFGGKVITWRREAEPAGAELPGRTPNVELFDAEKVGVRAVIRHWRPGDRFQPIGMEFPTKLQDWFVNRKVPRAARRSLLVAVAENGDIFWVEGQRIAESFKVTPATRKRLRWTWDSPGMPGG